MDDFTLNVWTKHRPISHLFLNLPLILFGAFWAFSGGESLALSAATLCYVVGAMIALRFVAQLFAYFKGDDFYVDYTKMSVPDLISAIMLIIMGCLISPIENWGSDSVRDSFFPIAIVMGIYLTVDSVLYLIHNVIVKRINPEERVAGEIVGAILLSLVYLAGTVMAFICQGNPEAVESSVVTFIIFVIGMFGGGIFNCVTAIVDYVKLHAKQERYTENMKDKYAIMFHRKRLINVFFAVASVLFGAIPFLAMRDFLTVWSILGVPLSLAIFVVIIIMCYRFCFGEKLFLSEQVCLADIFTGLLLIGGMIYPMTYGMGASSSDMYNFLSDQIPITMSIFMGYLFLYSALQLVGLAMGAKWDVLYQGRGWVRRFLFFTLESVVAAGMLIALLVLKGTMEGEICIFIAAGILILFPIINVISTFVRRDEI